MILFSIVYSLGFDVEDCAAKIHLGWGLRELYKIKHSHISKGNS
jgi:hypothetical protein